MNKMKTKCGKKYLLALFWFFMGYVCWFTGVYLFSFGISEYILPPATKYIQNNAPHYINIANFFLFNCANFILIILFTYILSGFFGCKALRVTAFIIWPIGHPMLDSILSLIFYNYDNGTPTPVFRYFIQLIASNIIINPIVALLGFTYGEKWYAKKKGALSLTAHSLEPT